MTQIYKGYEIVAVSGGSVDINTLQGSWIITTNNIEEAKRKIDRWTSSEVNLNLK